MGTSKEVVVSLGGTDFVVRPVPMGTLERVGEIVQEVLGQGSGLAGATDKEMAEGFPAVWRAVMAAPTRLLALFLGEGVTEDLIRAATFPEIVDAATAIMRVNRFDSLKALVPALRMASR